MSHHKSQTILVRCPDDRYSPGEMLHAGLKEILNCEDCLVRYEPNGFGGAMEFCHPETQTAWLWRFKIAGTLEPKIQRLIVINHTPGCGAVCAEFGPFASDDDEKNKHLELLEPYLSFGVILFLRWFDEL